MGKKRVRVTVVKSLSKIVGIEFEQYDTDPHLDWTYFNDDFIQRIMERSGFNSLKEYVDMFPGEYRYESKLTDRLGLVTPGVEKECSNRGELGIIGFGVSFNSITDGYTINGALERCKDLIGKNFDYNDIIGSITTLPTIDKFNRFTSVSNLSRYTDRLWFCEDWKEGSTP